MKKKFILGILLCLGCSIYAQKQVIPISPDSNAINVANSFTYALPKTAFLVNVTVEKVSEFKGCFADYASSLMGLSDYIKTTQTRFVVKDISVEDFLVPDPQTQFIVELSHKQISQGFLNTLLNDKYSLEDAYYTPFMDSISTQMPDFFRYYSNVQYEQVEESYLDTRIVNGVVSQVLVNQTKTIEKSSKQQAQEVAENISKIRHDRYDIITGKHEVPYSKEALEYMVNSLNDLEKKYLQLFSGLTIKQNLHYTIVVIPSDEKDLLIPIFTFSETSGLTDPQLNSSIGNYYLKIAPQMELDLWTEYTSLATKNKKSKTNSGYRIRHAMPAYLSLIKDNEEFAQLGVFQVYQLGKIETLPLFYDDLKIHHWGFIY